MQAGLPNAMVWIEGNIDAAENTFVQAELRPKSKSIKALPSKYQSGLCSAVQ